MREASLLEPFLFWEPDRSGEAERLSTAEEGDDGSLERFLPPLFRIDLTFLAGLDCVKEGLAAGSSPSSFPLPRPRPDDLR